MRMRAGASLSGWGNNELQCYTDSQTNVRVVRKRDTSDGALVINARFHTDGADCYNPGGVSARGAPHDAGRRSARTG